MSFHEDEPQSKEDMAAAADALLSRLGADPSKASKAKKAPKRKQFADEHQVVMYCHNDGTTDENGNIKRGKHLHLMVNRIHPQTGVLLPDKNDRDKVQSWALKYTKEHNTAQHTPARQEHHDARREKNADGKLTWVKHPNREHEDAYKQRKMLEASHANDNDQVKDIKEKQRRADHDLAERKRQQASHELEEMAALLHDDAQRQNVIDLAERRQIKRVEHEIRDKYRPEERAQKARHQEELQSQAVIEKSFFGRIGNALRGAKASVEEGTSTGLKRVYGIASRAGVRLGERKATQAAERDALARKKAEEQKAAIEAVKRAQAVKTDANRFRLQQDKQRLHAQHQAKRDALADKQTANNVQRKENAQKLSALARSVKKAQELTGRIKPVFRKFARSLSKKEESTGDDRPLKLQQPANDQPEQASKPPAPQEPQTASKPVSKAALLRQHQSKRGAAAFKEALRRPASEQDNERERWWIQKNAY